MTRKERLKYCTVCELRGFNPKEGTICSLTGRSATFEGTCPDYKENEKAVLSEQKKLREQEEEISKTINYGRYALLAIGGVFLILSLFEMLVTKDYSAFHNFIFLTVSFTFFYLASWPDEKTIVANKIGLVLFIIIVLIEGIIDPSRLINGFFIGGYSCVIFALIAAITVAKSEEKKSN